MKCDLFSSTIKSIWILFTLRAAFQPGSVWLFQRIACYMCICLRMCVLLRQTKESLSNIACDSFKFVPQFSVDSHIQMTQRHDEGVKQVEILTVWSNEYSDSTHLNTISFGTISTTMKKLQKLFSTARSNCSAC